MGHQSVEVITRNSFDTFIERNIGNLDEDIHGAFQQIATGEILNSVTPININTGIGKLIIVANAGGDPNGTITFTGDTVNRNDPSIITAGDTENVELSGLTTDASDTDAEGNVRHSFTGAYITSKWFSGAIAISTADVTLTDLDVWQVSFEQFADEGELRLSSFDFTGFTTNASAWAYLYLYGVIVNGFQCNITRLGSLSVTNAQVVVSQRSYRSKQGLAGAPILDKSSDGIFVNMFLGPGTTNRWRDINVKVWEELRTEIEIEDAIVESVGARSSRRTAQEVSSDFPTAEGTV